MSCWFWSAKIRALLAALPADLRARLSDHPNYQAACRLTESEPSQPDARSQLAQALAAASDRTVLQGLAASVPETADPAQPILTHLLSGQRYQLNHLNRTAGSGVGAGSKTEPDRQPLQAADGQPLESYLPKLFWWLWRCLPELACQELPWGEASLLLPASAWLPDVSLWSQASLSAAMAGALAGYRPREGAAADEQQLPHLAIFTFSPIQELIKASRKLRDFWAGSWLLHYLSVRVCWQLAKQYGPDSLVYPSLFQQPLIDHWLRQRWDEPGWTTWLEAPSERQLLTAGFPNVIILLLPPDAIPAAMATARQTLIREWLNVGQDVWQELRGGWTQHSPRGREPLELAAESATWNEWLRHQWQTYWVGLPLAREVAMLTHPIPAQPEAAESAQSWQAIRRWAASLNQTYSVPPPRQLFAEPEWALLQAAAAASPGLQANAGSWWCYCLCQLHYTNSASKSARSWRLPTAFLPRSTVSGLGPVVYPDVADSGPAWVSEAATRQFWRRQSGLFDGIEELNATETLKRCLNRILPSLLPSPPANDPKPRRFEEFYPDLCSGVAGWLRTQPTETARCYRTVCAVIARDLPDALCSVPKTHPWGIPWVDNAAWPDDSEPWPHPRLLHAGWLVADSEVEVEQRRSLQAAATQVINRYFPPGRNPTDWYVFAAGDGDGIGQWLQGKYLKSYGDYMPLPLGTNEVGAGAGASTSANSNLQRALEGFQNLQKRMGPGTHNAFSRALLDFSNQLVPYLTEQRYAGRLIYSGGDDVLAYTNLWEWDNWLWDIRQCFRGAADLRGEFTNTGDYWQRRREFTPPQDAAGQPWSPELPRRPLFTLGSHRTSLSFGVAIAHHSVPLAIALENLWAAEGGAKDYGYYRTGADGQQHWQPKNAVQVRVLYSNGNILTVTGTCETLRVWQRLLNVAVAADSDANDSPAAFQPESALFEQAVQLYHQHPIPDLAAIAPWTQAFCSRRDVLRAKTERVAFQRQLAQFLTQLWQTTTQETPQKTNKRRDDAVQAWLKLAAFVQRNRDLQPLGELSQQLRQST